MPKISVIVPVYKVENYLDKCIESIQNQSYSDIEIILVDDGSPDNCGKICDEYAKNDTRIKVLHKENAGVSVARNTGMAAATGEYIMFVDSDDYIDENMISDMVSHLPADIVICGLKYVNTDGTVLDLYFLDSEESITREEFIDSYFEIAERRHIFGGPVNKLFKKKIISEHNLEFNPEISICEDTLFVIEYLKKSENVSLVSKPYYNYVRYGSDTLTCKYNDNAFEICKMLYKEKLELVKASEKYNMSYMYEYHITLYIGFFSYIYAFSNLSHKEKYKKLKSAVNDEFLHMLLDKAKMTHKRKLIKLSAKSHFVLPLHCMYSVYWLWKGKIWKKR